MRYSIKVKPKAKRNEVKQQGEILEVLVTAPPDKGKANEEVRKVLAEHFGISKSKVIILKGEHSRNKIVEIDL